jgi:hypothetical protein
MIKPRDLDWAEFSEFFHSLAVVVGGEDGIGDLPAASSESTSELDAECDAWCRLLMSHLHHPPDAPRHIRPWIVARCIAASSLARSLAGSGASSPGPLTPELIEQMLVAEWHGALRDLWRQR